MNRIKQLRLARGLSLEDLAAAMGGIVSKQALSKYENETAKPSAVILGQLSRVLRVKSCELWEYPRYAVEFLGYRKRSSLPKKWQASFEAKVIEQLDIRLKLKDDGDDKPFDVPCLELAVASEAEAEECAQDLRRRWDLGGGPIPNLTDVLEDRGIHVLTEDGPEKFDGISAWVRDPDQRPKAAAVVVRAQGPGERQRLTLAHELGHLVAKPNECVDEEKMAFRFGASFLVPAEALRSEVGRKRNRIRVEELYLLKEHFGVSIQALVRRLRDTESIEETAYKWWCMFISRSGWRRDEPKPQRREVPTWFRRTVLRRVAEGQLSHEEGGALLNEQLCESAGPTTLRRKAFLALPPEEQRRQLEAQAEQLQQHYAHLKDEWDGTLADGLNDA